MDLRSLIHREKGIGELTLTFQFVHPANAPLCRARLLVLDL